MVNIFLKRNRNSFLRCLSGLR